MMHNVELFLEAIVGIIFPEFFFLFFFGKITITIIRDKDFYVSMVNGHDGNDNKEYQGRGTPLILFIFYTGKNYMIVCNHFFF